MPSGGAHGVIMGYIFAILEPFLKKRDLMLLLDIFMLYRDENGVKRRVGPDLVFTQLEEQEPSAYDLDDRQPPTCLGEIISPDSRTQDVEDKLAKYTALGIRRYFVVDALDENGLPSGSVSFRVWFLGMEQRPDENGFLLLPELGVKVLPKAEKIRFFELESSEPLPDAESWEALTKDLKADLEAKDRDLAARDDEIARLKEELDRLRGE